MARKTTLFVAFTVSLALATGFTPLPQAAPFTNSLRFELSGRGFGLGLDLAFWLPCAQAAGSLEDLRRAIIEAQIFPKSDQISVSTGDGETHIVVGLNRTAEELDKDCKIDAMLAARAVMQADADIARAKTRFIDFRRRTCRQVTVKAGDLAAFAAGGIDKEKLLNSLEVVPVVFESAWTELAGNAVNSSKAFGADFRVSVALNRDEATVSTYMTKESSDKDFNCKALAIVMAQKLLAADPTLSAVRTCFYAVNGKDYRSVTVKASDIRSFESGSLASQKLLDTLGIEPHTATEPAGTGTAGTKAGTQAAGSATGQATASAAQATGTAPGQTKPPADDNLLTLSAAGIQFTYPKNNWIVRTSPSGENIKLSSTRLSKDDYIELELLRVPSSPAGLLHKEERNWLLMQNSQLLYTKPRTIGVGNRVGVLDWLFNYYSAGPDYPEFHYYKRCVYFGEPGRIYRLSFHAVRKDYAWVNADFEQMLASLIVPGSTRPAAGAGVRNTTAASRSQAGGAAKKSTGHK